MHEFFEMLNHSLIHIDVEDSITHWLVASEIGFLVLHKAAIPTQSFFFLCVLPLLKQCEFEFFLLNFGWCITDG